jgi:hypothetical protein
VSVYVNVSQTGPQAPVTGAVLQSVGKNINAAYSATAGYNDQPALQAEETVTGESWTYTASAGAGVVYSPTAQGTGSSATVTAKSAAAGTYTITVTFELTFTITKYKADGVTVDSTRTDGPYSGSGSATLNVKDGKFKVEIAPTDMFRGRRNTLGIGEPASIVVEQENPSDPPVSFDSMEVYENINSEGGNTLIDIKSPSFKAGHYGGTAKIKVWAKINGIKEQVPETIGVSVIEPSSIITEKIVKIPNPSPPHAYAGFIGRPYVLPITVSFLYTEVREGTYPSEQKGYWAQKFPGGIPHPDGNWADIVAGLTADKHNKVNWIDAIDSGVCRQPPMYAAGSYFQWNIPWFYRVKGAPENQNKKITVIHRVDMTNDQGHMTITKATGTEMYPP